MYVNVFRSRKRADYAAAAFAADDAAMEALARTQPGFVEYKWFAAEDGETCSISVWESEDHARAWGAHPEHAAVQARGRLGYYETYTMYTFVDPAVKSFERLAE